MSYKVGLVEDQHEGSAVTHRVDIHQCELRLTTDRDLDVLKPNGPPSVRQREREAERARDRGKESERQREAERVCEREAAGGAARKGSDAARADGQGSQPLSVLPHRLLRQIVDVLHLLASEEVGALDGDPVVGRRPLPRTYSGRECAVKEKERQSTRKLWSVVTCRQGLRSESSVKNGKRWKHSAWLSCCTVASPCL